MNYVIIIAIAFKISKIFRNIALWVLYPPVPHRLYSSLRKRGQRGRKTNEMKVASVASVAWAV